MGQKYAKALLGLGVVFIGHSVSLAFSCGSRVNVSEAFRLADEVFVGKVISVVRLPSRSSTFKLADGTFAVSVEESGLEITEIEVKKSYRGSPPGTVEFIQGTAVSGRFSFIAGESYLIFSKWNGGRRETNFCSGNRVFKEATEQLKFLEDRTRTLSVLHGNIVRADTHIGLTDSNAEYLVVANHGDKRLERELEKCGSFEMVLEPGDYRIWVEFRGKVVSEIEEMTLGSSEVYRKVVRIR